MNRHEFVAFVAAVMAVNALGVDLMLPSLPTIGHELLVVTANARQWIVTAYILGFGLGQLVYGPLADRYGRKPVLLITLAGFVLATLFAAGSTTYPALLGARVLQGLMSASTRVLAVAIVRDNFSGRRMARTMSLAQMIFFLVPIVAPSIGQLLLHFGFWRIIFYALATFAASVFAWTATRLPETLPPARRIPLSLASLAENYSLTLTNRYSVGYAAAASLTFGGIIAFVSCAQQVFVDEFAAGDRFTLLFAICAFSMGCASFANSRLVERVGTRVISQTGALTLIALSLAHTVVIEAGLETLPGFVLFQALSNDLHRPMRFQFRCDGHGASRAHRRQRVFRSRLHCQYRRCDRRIDYRPILQRQHATASAWLSRHRIGGDRDYRDRGARAAVSGTYDG